MRTQSSGRITCSFQWTLATFCKHSSQSTNCSTWERIGKSQLMSSLWMFSLQLSFAWAIAPKRIQMNWPASRRVCWRHSLESVHNRHWTRRYYRLFFISSKFNGLWGSLTQFLQQKPICAVTSRPPASQHYYLYWEMLKTCQTKHAHWLYRL